MWSHRAVCLMSVLLSSLITERGVAESPANMTPAGEDKPSASVDPQLFQESQEVFTDDEQWARSGFRLGLGYYQSTLSGFGASPSGIIDGVEIDVGARLDSAWSLSGALRYGVGSEELSGLIFSGMLTSAWHWGGLSLGVGVGVRGYIEQREARPNPHLSLMTDVIAPYTLSEDLAPLTRCVGFGPLSGLSLKYHFPISQITALTLGARVDASRVGCELETDRVEPDTAQGIYLRQYWTSWSWSWVGGFTWR